MGENNAFKRKIERYNIFEAIFNLKFKWWSQLSSSARPIQNGHLNNIGTWVVFGDWECVSIELVLLVTRNICTHIHIPESNSVWILLTYTTTLHTWIIVSMARGFLFFFLLKRGSVWIFYQMGCDELVPVLNFVFIGWTIMGLLIISPDNMVMCCFL